MVYLQMFWEFFKTGLFSIGGGLATLPFLYKIADKYTWFDAAVLPDMIAISESTPGPLGVNMATYAGFQVGGVPGAMLATFALILPSIIIIILIAKFLSHFNQNPLVQSAFYGLRPASAGLIAVATVEVFKVSVIAWQQFTATWDPLQFFNYKGLILFAVLFGASMIKPLKKLHPVVYILAAAVAGVIFQF